MQVPFLDLKVQYQSIKTDVDAAIQKVIDNTAFILGESVANFEQNFAKAHNAKYCIGVSSGTDGNHLATWSLGIKPGDEVIIPANTFIATAWGATLCGATPIMVDCHPDNYNLDPEKVEAAITPKTKAIVAVHLYGQPADMDKLREIANQHNLFLIEDAAQAHLAEYNGEKVGGLSTAASFSFYPGKNLGAYGEAGAVLTNDDQLANNLKMLREHGQSEKYCHQSFGHNYRMEGIQGAVLGVKLKYLDKWTEGRRRVAAKYKELLSDIDTIRLPIEMPYAKHVYHLFVIQVNGSNGKDTRDKLQKFLGENGVATGLHYPIPLHQQNCFSYLGYKEGDFPVTEQLATTGLSLPMFPELSDDKIQYVSEKLKEFFVN
ncbi:MAG: DegT/DnrJ/EryC1/StrS family aminotransferase [Ignavibacterium sp.]|nr:MAG: DegT/DnrJ/EryC1/StrS family aminotransferase [Ignavibacterium sp.]